MCILFALHTVDLDGSTISFFDTACALRKKNIEVYAITPLINGKMQMLLRKNNITYVQSNFKWAVKSKEKKEQYKIIQQVKTVKYIMNKVNEWNIDIIHSNSSVVSIGATVSLLTGIPHIWHFRENFKKMNLEQRFPCYYHF